jgi:hypothetical protein
MSRRRPPIIHFGFDPKQSQHHFAVIWTGMDEVSLVERFTWETSAQLPVAPKVALKAKLKRHEWLRIEAAVANDFNERLQRLGYPPAAWQPQETVVASHFGKELTLLAWAVEDADESVIPNMIGNWRGLAPEERWWLYTTINATSGHPEYGKERGWRKAIKIAFSENPILPVSPTAGVMTSSLLSGSLRRKSARETPADGQGQLPLE